MGHRSKFTFPVPGRKPKPSPPSTAAGPALTKAERILGTGGINVDSPTQSSVRSPPQPWDAKSGISISISESSDGYATVQTGLGIRGDDNDDYEDGATAGTSYAHAPCPWDLESDIIPRQLRSAQGQDYVNPLRPKRSAATIGHDYRDATTTAASTMMRRQSNASTIFTHYDPHQVPLSISQQTSSSAMAKGLPSKVSNLLDVDALLGKSSDKRKPAKLDLSRLRPGNRSNKDASPQIDPVLGNNYVMRSPSFVSQTSPIKEVGFPMPPTNAYGGSGNSKRSSRKITKLPPGSNNQSTDTLPSAISKMSDLNQLYDHYERQLFGQEDEEPEESSSPLLEFPMPPMTDHRFSSEPSPPLTTASTHMSSLFVTPLSNPVVRSHQQQQLPYRSRQDSNTSQKATATAILPSQSHLQHSQEDVSSISSRNTRTSKVSQQKSPLDTNLQQRSVLSLSDSESEDETFSDSAPMSSMSSHGQASHGGSPASDYRKRPLPQQPTAPNHDHSGQAESKSNTYGQLSEFLTVPTSNSSLVPRSSPAVSQTTLRSASSSSTTTGVSKSGSAPAPDRGSGLSARSSSTVESLSRAKPARQPQDVYGVHEAKVIAILPVASTADAAMGGPESDYREFDHRISRQGSNHLGGSQRNSDQPTPPLSPTSVDFYMQSPKSIDRSSVSESAATEAHNARFMAVTRQEEMLLAALRKKRAIMRENILAEIEGEKGSVASLDTSSSTSGSRSSRQFDNKGPAVSAHGRKTSSGSDSMPLPKRNTPSPQIVFPGRSSSLARDMKDLTDYRSGSSLSQRRTGPASKSAMRAASSSRLPSTTAHLRDSTDSDLRLSSYGAAGGPIAPPAGHDRRERVLMFLDRPLGGLDAIDSAEPSPDLSEFLDFDMERHHDDDQRRSRSRSRYNTASGGSGHHGYGGGSTSSSNHGYYSSSNSRRTSNRPRADSNALNAVTSPLRIQLDGVPEQEYHDDEEDDDEDDLYDDDDHFDGFSDVIEHERLTTMGSNYSRAAHQQQQQQSAARPDSPVHQMLGHIKGKNSTVRISAVGPSWGDDD